MTLDRSHPVRVVLDHAAMGERPTDVTLDALRLTAADRRRVEAAALGIYSKRLDGENGAARAAARDAYAIVDDLHPDTHDPGYLTAGGPQVTDPAQLAADLPRN